MTCLPSGIHRNSLLLQRLEMKLFPCNSVAADPLLENASW